MIFQLCFGIFLVLLGSFLISEEILLKTVKKEVQKRLLLVEGTKRYNIWSSPMFLSFTCYLFNVTNPDEVMRGENPRLVEYGPFSYDEIQEKQIIDVDEERDEIKYTTRSTYIFNKYRSLNVSNREKVTILNPAYIGAIVTLTSLPADIMEKYGNNIPKLFQNHSSIFLKARATDILFSGVKVTCNLKKYPELNLMCKILRTKPPPVLRASDREDVYYFSTFQRINDSLRGPFIVSRGLQNISRLGDITSFNGDQVQKLWNTEACNTVRGTDTVTWAPLVEPLPFVSTFIPEMCRTIEADYENDVSIHGITGSQFIMKERVWFLNHSECYCPIVDNELECAPQGLIDVTNCQNVPVVLSEPHFLHADPEVLNYARGLVPNEGLHKTYIVIEPYTGTPLSGQKKTQLNLKLTRQPVELLSNVSEGYFPIMWCENGNTPTLSVISFTYQMLRLINFIKYIQYVPLVVGIYIISMTILLYSVTQRKVHPKIPNVQTIFILSNSQLDNVVRRPSQRPRPR